MYEAYEAAAMTSHQEILSQKQGKLSAFGLIATNQLVANQG
ncbi:MAG TPA: hypothetical protein V6C97_02595 [Oculatellaceae cyanobacterium]